jgi:hypothetical protein
MPEYKYAYCFPIGGTIQWSAETDESLQKRPDNDEDQVAVDDFIATAENGDFVTFTTGEIAFKTRL